jgi:hypothetical protein
LKFQVTQLDSNYDHVNQNTRQAQANNHHNHHNHAHQINQQNNNQNINNQINAHLVVYKIPTLFTRLMAEIFDAFYIQLIKIFIAIALVNYTDLL